MSDSTPEAKPESTFLCAKCDYTVTSTTVVEDSLAHLRQEHGHP